MLEVHAIAHTRSHSSGSQTAQLAPRHRVRVHLTFSNGQLFAEFGTKQVHVLQLRYLGLDPQSNFGVIATVLRGSQHRIPLTWLL